LPALSFACGELVEPSKGTRAEKLGPSGFVRGFLIAFKHLKSFEQKLAKIAKAGAANTPLPHDNYWNSTPSYLRRRQNHFFLRGLRVLLFKIFSSPCRTKE